jgi:hypothetical protein
VPDTSYKCAVCGELYRSEGGAQACVESHNTVYIKFTREELFKLIQFIYTKDSSLIPEDLMKKLLIHKRGFYV